MILSTEIASVGQVPVKPYESSFGQTWFIEGNFKDGSFFSRGAKSAEGAEKLRTQLVDLVGKPNDFEVEDTNREYQGKKKWKLKAVPGQQAYQGNYGYKGGGTSRPPQASGASSYRYSEQGTREERDSIVRQVALKCAVEITAPGQGATVENVTAMADYFYRWLTQKSAEGVQEASAHERYSNEITQAVKDKSPQRLEALMKMIKTSFSKGSLNIDQVAALDDELIAAKKALASAAAMDEWYRSKQAAARQNEPVHSSSAMADTILQSQEAF